MECHIKEVTEIFKEQGKKLKNLVLKKKLTTRFPIRWWGAEKDSKVVFLPLLMIPLLTR